MTTLVTNEVRDLYKQFQLNHMFFQNAMNRVPDAAFEKPVTENTASFQWIAAHLANTKCRLANSLGASLDLPWDEKVGGMETVYDPAETYPSKQEVLDVWNSATEKFLELLAQATEELLGESVEFPIPVMDPNKQGLATFLCFHESYHIGQLGLLVRAGGGKALVKP